jgi:hypothetical protein
MPSKVPLEHFMETSWWRNWTYYLIAIAYVQSAAGFPIEDGRSGASRNTGSHSFEVEIGSESLHVHPPNGRKRRVAEEVVLGKELAGPGAALEVQGEEAVLIRRQTIEGDAAAENAATRRERIKATHPSAIRMLFRQSAASQDGAFPYFAGHWNGHRNNWYGDVGIGFVPQKDFTIVSLGRHNNSDFPLQENVPVTLWSVQTGEALAIVEIGPNSYSEGHYLWEPVEAPGVAVSQGKEYRLTQACQPGMKDKWFDMTVPYHELQRLSATSYARFVGAVNQSGFGFPTNSDGQFRRAGMVNFKLGKPPVREIENGSHRCSTLLAVATSIFAVILALA